MSAEREMQRLRSCVRPVVFETGLKDFPLSTAGTAFILADRAKTFVVTARHVLRNYDPGRLRIYPSFASNRFLKISDYYSINAESPGEEAEDFIVLEVGSVPRRYSFVINLPEKHESWVEYRESAEYFLLGYPEPTTYIDYQKSILHAGQVLMVGRYQGPSVSRYCYELRVDNSHGLRTFSGFSGGPVFSVKQRIAEPYTVVLCGIALQGTPTSGLVRFLDCELIKSAMEQIHTPPDLRRARWEA